MTTEIHVFLFRRDFRIHDNLAFNRLVAESGSGVEDETGGYKQPEHFLQTERLGAKLHVVVGPAAG